MLQCFVAMAIGTAETDRLFKFMRRALRRIGVNAYRVDTVEHNNNIDAQIMTELNRCDLAIADLTFARPSVYFEAGFAESRVKVVYTCKRDHFKARADDAYGNFRVHFDLQMRNIIDWRSVDDPLFASRLTKRVSKVIAPILRNNAQRDKERIETEEFNRASRWQKEATLLASFKRSISIGRFEQREEVLNQWIGVLKKSRRIHLLDFALIGKEPPKEIARRSDGAWFGFHRFYRSLEEKHQTPPASIETHMVIASVNSISDSRIPETHPFAVRTDTGAYSWSQSYKWSGGRRFQPPLELPNPITLHLIPQIKSPREFCRRLKLALAGTGFLAQE